MPDSQVKSRVMAHPARRFVYADPNEATPTEPPPRRRAVLDFIVAYHRRNRKMPSVQEVSEHMGYEHSYSARDVLQKLVSDGQLTRTRDGGRIIYGLRAHNLADQSESV